MIMKNQTLIVGIGNIIRGDDGMGIHLARRLREILPQRFTIKELETAGLDLIEAISGYSKVILIDAIQTSCGVPGQVYRLSLQEFKHSFNLSSMHALDLNQVMELRRKLTGTKIPRVEILAVETKKLNEFSESLSPQIEEKFDTILDAVKAEIERES